MFDRAASTCTLRIDRRRSGAHWFVQSTAETRRTRNVYLVAVLRNDFPSPIARRATRKRLAAAGAAARPAEQRDRKRAAGPGCASTSTTSTSASSHLPIPAGDLSNLQVGGGRSALLPARQQTARPAGPGAARQADALHRFDLAKRKDDAGARQPRDYRVSADGEEGALRRARRVAHRVDAGEDRPGGGAASTVADHRGVHRSARRVEADVRRSVADQSRLLLRPEHARLDWPAMREKYSRLPARPHVAKRSQRA